MQHPDLLLVLRRCWRSLLVQPSRFPLLEDSAVLPGLVLLLLLLHAPMGLRYAAGLQPSGLRPTLLLLCCRVMSEG